MVVVDRGYGTELLDGKLAMLSACLPRGTLRNPIERWEDDGREAARANVALARGTTAARVGQLRKNR